MCSAWTRPPDAPPALRLERAAGRPEAARRADERALQIARDLSSKEGLAAVQKALDALDAAQAR